ncbi:DUF3800 domain-containing protein [Chelatococcus asaccharovorans]|uniref:DUF3800 domain-containing protein n=1 Tax=Chelatococcus asaccharovorans TaxID=28210 RepID=UPI0014763C35|nr:DUF3800 domain-containing protein [Chelatococcus asaccharovorans]MBS7702507.1 DUF3800 domain-containing protein [Chelatococcus asaccharovorans]
MRVIFVDETGHSRNEPVAIVAGLILDPDLQWRNLADRIEALKVEVPEKFRERFIFHATDLEHGGRFRREWPDEDRWALLDRLIALPRELNIPLVMGFFAKPAERDANLARESKVVHALAYGECIQAADWFMKNRAGENEVAMLVAEQREEARRAIKAIHRLYNQEELLKRWFPDHLRQVRPGLPIAKIKGPPNFAAKEDEPLLQIADACAFVFQRHFRGAERSQRRLEALFGDFAHPAVFGKLKSSPANYACFWWQDSGAQHWG